jgi:hypothetical protein
MKLEIQLFGGRGASSSNTKGETYEQYVKRTLSNVDYLRENRPNEYMRNIVNEGKVDGKDVVTSANGYKYWNIGKNAPDGYIGLIKGTGSNAKTVYMKTQYANEIANFKSAGSNAMNYDSIKTLDRTITTREKTIERYKNSNRNTTKLEAELKEMKRAREIRRRLGL